MHVLHIRAGYKKACPFLKRTSSSSLRHLSVGNGLRLKATGCPVLSPVLAQREAEINQMPTLQKRGYAAVADRSSIDEIHRKEGIISGRGGVCPHASAAKAASQKAQSFAAAAEEGVPQTLANMQEATPYVPSAHVKKGRFDYASFYNEELQKKHRDKSYRYIIGPYHYTRAHRLCADTSITSIDLRPNSQSLIPAR